MENDTRVSMFNAWFLCTSCQFSICWKKKKLRPQEAFPSAEHWCHFQCLSCKVVIGAIAPIIWCTAPQETVGYQIHSIHRDSVAQLSKLEWDNAQVVKVFVFPLDLNRWSHNTQSLITNSSRALALKLVEANKNFLIG